MSALPQPSHGEEPTGYRETPSMILPPVTPTELDVAIDAAWKRTTALTSRGRDLDFAVGDEGDLRIALRDRRKGAATPVSPSQAVNLLAGLRQV